MSRGLAVGDLDDDGRLDVVINDLDGAPQVLRNEIAGPGHWLLVKLTGKGKNTNAIGAIVTVTRRRRRPGRASCRAGPATSRRTTCASTSGWARARQADGVEVRWPDGTATTLADVKADQVIDVRQPR